MPEAALRCSDPDLPGEDLDGEGLQHESMSEWAEGNMSTDKQGPNLMISRNGASPNALQKCAQCQHLKSAHYFGDTLDFWVCGKLTTPTGHNMPWSETNRACGLFGEREKG